MTDETRLTDRVSPFVLKMITDSSIKYRQAYKSYAFGLKQQVMGKWLWIVIGTIVGIVILLYLTGNLALGK